MSDVLKVRAVHDDDGSVGLLASVTSGGFSGRGEAWFNVSEVKEFADQLRHFAETTEKPPFIQGGNWDGKGNLVEVLLSFRFYIFSSYRAGVQVSLADYPYTDCRKEEISRVTVELKPETQAIINFCLQLDKVLSANNDAPVLECH